MEAKVNQYQVFEKVNVEKLIVVLNKQQNELEKIKKDNSNFNARLDAQARRNRDELRDVHHKFQNENQLKLRAMTQIEALRNEIEDLENNGSAGTIWKEKCKEIYQICINLKEDNQYISDRCRQIADLAVKVINSYQKDVLESGSEDKLDEKSSFRKSIGLSLPKL